MQGSWTIAAVRNERKSAFFFCSSKFNDSCALTRYDRSPFHRRQGGPPTPVYEDAFLRLYVENVQRSADGQEVKFTARYEGARGKTLTAFRVQAAVPKQMKLRLDPPSGATLDSSVCVTQRMSIVGASGNAIVMKVRLNFEDGGDQITNIAEVIVDTN